MSPIIPHISEEIRAVLGGESLVTNAFWTMVDSLMLATGPGTLFAAGNGKVRDELLNGEIFYSLREA